MSGLLDANVAMVSQKLGLRLSSRGGSGTGKMTSLPEPDVQPITARLAAAGSRRWELEALLAAAPSSAAGAAYAELILTGNVAGKASAVSRLKLLAQLRARYQLDPEVAEFRAFREAMNLDSNSKERGLLCYLMMARGDRLFRELSLLLLSSVTRQQTVVDARHFEGAVRDHVAAGGCRWSDETLQHVRQHVLSSLKDFGVLRGSRTKRLAEIRPGPTVALFAARLSELEGLTSRQVLSSRWFRLLRLEPGLVAQVLREAQRVGLLTFRMQADVVELVLPPLGAP